LLRRLPVATPKEVDKTKKILSLVLKLRNAGIEGGTGKQFPALPGLILDVDSLIQQLKNGEYADAAITVVSIGGNLASISSWLITAAIEMGVPIGVTSAMAQSGVVLGVIGEIAGPAVIALSTLIEVARIPSGVNENQGKIYYIADVSGILTSWLFNNPSISPHSQLMVEARTGGYFGSDLTKYLRDAHRTAHEIWQSYFSGHPERVTHARKEVAGNYQACWRLLGQQLEPKLKPEPDGIALSFINKLIAGVEELRKERLREERYRRRGLL